ncbi:MAG: hypothetical protein LBE33_09415 [Zoogloeaceae bacterium]|jgi:hypothetical protein|nr:hypothetical protein [Zoogloeaceae bacterium]
MNKKWAYALIWRHPALGFVILIAAGIGWLIHEEMGIRFSLEIVPLTSKVATTSATERGIKTERDAP